MHVVPITVLNRKDDQILSTGQDLPVADCNMLLIFLPFLLQFQISSNYKELTDSPAI